MAELKDRFERLVSSFSIDDQKLMMDLWEKYCYTPNADDAIKILSGLYGMVKSFESDIYDCCRPNIREYIVPDWVECACRICDAYNKQMGQSARDARLQSKLSEWGVGGAGQQQGDAVGWKSALPPILNTDKAVRVFGKAIGAGLMEWTGARFQWHGSNALLAYLCGIVYCGDTKRLDDFTKVVKVKRGSDYFPETELKRLFGVKHLGQSRLQLTTPPRGYEKVDEIV